jgi:muconolactone delta-isomerase
VITPGAFVVSRAGIDVPDVPLDGVAFRPMPSVLEWLIGNRASAITIRSTVFVRSDIVEAVVAGGMPELAAHELVHVRQWREQGTVRFLWRYLSEYLRLRVFGLGHDAAYRRIGAEWTAYAEAANIVQRP